MSSLSPILSSPWAEAMGWTVIHSIWQGVLIAIILRAILVLFAQKSASTKYRISYAALMSQLLLSVCTFAYLYKPALNVSSTVMPTIPAGTTIAASETAMSWWEGWEAVLTPFLPVIVCLWIAGMMFFLTRLGFSWWYWQTVKTKHTSMAPKAWMALLNQLHERFEFKVNIQLKLSKYITSPLLLGQLKPVILFPVALVNQLSLEQVEAIIAHELAHLSRFDYFLNWVQLIIESFFYYHPAIWWIGGQVRELREHCCDDRAVAFTGDSLLYAKTLLEIAERNQHFVTPKLAVAFSQQNEKSLLKRIHRILKQPSKQPEMREKFFVTSILLIAALVVSLGAGWPNGDFLVSENSSFELITLDTLPQGDIHLKVNEDGEKMDVELEDGAIKKLIVNDEEIPAAQYPEYQERVEGLFDKAAEEGMHREHRVQRRIIVEDDDSESSERHIRIRKRMGEGSDEEMRWIDDGGEEHVIIRKNGDGDVIIRTLDEDGEVLIEEIQGRSHGNRKVNVVIDTIDGEIQKTVTVEYEDEVIDILGGEGSEKEVRVFLLDGDDVLDIDNEDLDFDFDGDNVFILKSGDDEDSILEWEEERVIRRELLEGERERLHELREHRVIEIEERREEMEERSEEMEERRMEMRERVEEMEERREEMEIEIVREVERMQEDLEREMEVIELRLHERNSQSWIENQMLEDGLIDDVENYKIELSSNRMKVNGKKMDDDTHQRYMDLYEHQTGNSIEGSKISISKRN